jgi:hypothetical protein
MVNVQEWHSQASPPRLIINWDRFELSYAESDLVDIELWGYYEDGEGPHWDFIQVRKNIIDCARIKFFF